VNLALMMLLALLWSVVLLPSAMRSRRRSLHQSMGGFSKTMHALAGDHTWPEARPILVPGNAARIVVPQSANERARDRRRQMLVALASLSGLATVLAGVASGPFVPLAVAFVAGLVVYIRALRTLAVRDRHARELVRLDDRRSFDARPEEFDRRAFGS
jgi:hypothetical protein